MSIIELKTTQPSAPDSTAKVTDLFDIDCNWTVPCFSESGPLVPARDENYVFHPDTTRSILAGIIHNRRILLQGLHGTGKSSHIEQIASRLNWPCVRVNLDSHISRVDLMGKETIALEDGQQVTRFQEGVLPWAVQNPCILVLDEYDAGRPDVMFVIQRILETDGRLTLLDKNIVIEPHPYFRIFATANTTGLGDTTGLYHGTNALNQGQLDRWDIIANLDYLPEETEVAIIRAKVPDLQQAIGQGKNDDIVVPMVRLANLTRTGFAAGDLSTLMSPRTVLTWGQNAVIFGDLAGAFAVSFMNRCDEAEHDTLAEYYQRCFDQDLYEQLAA